MPQTVSNTYTQSVRGPIVCKPHATHQAPVTCNMWCAMWYQGTAQLLSLTEFESHLFQLHSIGWTINQWRIGCLLACLTLNLLVSVVKLVNPKICSVLNKKRLNFALKIKRLEENFLIYAEDENRALVSIISRACLSSQACTARVVWCGAGH